MIKFTLGETLIALGIIVVEFSRHILLMNDMVVVFLLDALIPDSTGIAPQR